LASPRESWRGVALIGLSLLGLALCVAATAAFSLAQRFPRELDRYVMTRTGEAALFRVTYAGGSTGYLTVNIVRPGADSLSYAAVFGEGGRAVQANYRFTNWNGTGEPYTRSDTLARHGNQLLLLAQELPEGLVQWDPPVDAWPAGLLASSAAAPIEGETHIADETWAYRQWHDGTESVTLPDGSPATAERFRVQWWNNDTLVETTTQWIVPGIGEVRLEQHDGDGQLVMAAELLNNTRLNPDNTATLPLAELLAPGDGTTALFREGPTRTGAWPDTALGGPNLKITYRRESGVSVTASPAYADGIIYLADQNGLLLALEPGQDMPRWQFTAGGPIVAAPAVADGVVYIGAGDKRLYALAAREGHFLWQRPFFDNVSTSPVIADGTLYVGAEDRTLYALDARTGVVRWRFVAGDRIVSSPAIADGRLFFGADDGLVYALDAATGDLHWRFAMDGLVEATPAVSGGLVLALSNGQQVAAIEAATGEARWTATTRFGYLASPAASQDHVYVTDTGGGVHAYDLASGALAWEWFTPDDAGFVSSPLLVGGHLIAIDSRAMLLVWDAATGALLHSLAVGEAMTASPTWTGEAVVVANGAGDLLTLQGGPVTESRP
jgi:outer membrane protein assembly factor BamB